ncbi:hypothetical protein HPB52_014023 [Rhipicephalus sanguineus]|uniref:Uncharacterized protein n=1 Tax=Rhipicephalus sanguineus TaxID=34632 RepID=A0A9D4PZ06_RHISA|nr:hypothetical protein HPB52_014023 [Rhipicephalus sanguineus]
MRHMAPLCPRRGRDAESPPKMDHGPLRCASPAAVSRLILIAGCHQGLLTEAASSLSSFLLRLEAVAFLAPPPPLGY